ncbi:MAG: hypothetical protein AAGE80_00080 [Pseudomonadota bacterium]
MPGTVKIWWHSGALRDEKYNAVPIVEEPELATETIALNGGVEVSAASPEDARIALIQSDIDIAYVVRLPGSDVTANAAIHKPMAATGLDLHAVAIPGGASISVVEIF